MADATLLIHLFGFTIGVIAVMMLIFQAVLLGRDDWSILSVRFFLKQKTTEEYHMFILYSVAIAVVALTANHLVTFFEGYTALGTILQFTSTIFLTLTVLYLYEMQEHLSIPRK